MPEIETNMHKTLEKSSSEIASSKAKSDCVNITPKQNLSSNYSCDTHLDFDGNTRESIIIRSQPKAVLEGYILPYLSGTYPIGFELDYPESTMSVQTICKTNNNIWEVGLKKFKILTTLSNSNQTN